MIPAEFSVTELAERLQVPRKKIAYRVANGQLPGRKLGTGRNSKVVIPVAELREQFPAFWAIVMENLALKQEMEGDER